MIDKPMWVGKGEDTTKYHNAVNSNMMDASQHAA